MKTKLIPTTFIGKLWIILVFTLTLFVAIIANGCSTSNQALDSNSNTNLGGDELSIDNAAPVPVLDGRATKAGVYIRNNTSHVIVGISYQLDTGTAAKPAINLNSYECNRIEPNSSCLLGFTTRSIKIGEADNVLIVAHFEGKKVKQLINLEYANTHQCNQVQFSGEVSLFKLGNYATAYAYTCGNHSYNDVGFYPLEKSVAIVGNINNGYITINAGEVLPLQVTTGQTVTSNNVMVVPYISSEIGFNNMHNDFELRDKLKQRITSKSSLGAGLLGVTISPTTQANLIMSKLPVVYDISESQTLTIFNNGSLSATSISLTLPAQLTQLSTTCSTTLAAGGSCSYTVKLANSLTGNGAAALSIGYNNGNQSVTTSELVYYYLDKLDAMVYITPSPASLSMNVNESQTVSFTLYNIGGQAVNSSPSITFSQSGLSAVTLTTLNDNCGSGLAANNGSCTITGKITSGNTSGTGKTYLQAQVVSASGTSFSFVSPSIATTIIDPSPAITNITPQNASTNVNTATSIQLSFNVAMNPARLSVYNIQLFRESDNFQISLNPGVVAADNKSVTFTIASGSSLNSMINYKIVVNQVNILSATGLALGSNPTYTASTFTTGEWTAPTIVSYQPFDGAILQSRNSTVRLTFNESMDVPSLTESGVVRLINSSDGSEIPLQNPQWVVDSSGYSYYVNHVTFASLTNYRLVINQTKVRDAGLNKVPIGSNESYTVASFSTATFTNPTISSVSPAINATGVSTTESLSITFSGTMDTSTLTNANIKLKQVYTNTYLTLTNPVYNYINNVVTFTISGGMQANTTYQVELTPANIRDQINQLTLDVSGFNNNSSSYQFTTGGANNPSGFAFYTNWAGASLGSLFYGESSIVFSYAGNPVYGFVSRTASEEYIIFNPSQNGIAMYRSESGVNWFPQKLPSNLLAANDPNNATNISINALYCSKVANNCFLVGNSGTIFRSGDNAYTWSQITSNTSYNLYAIACDNVTGQNCVAGGGDGTTGVALYSNDYGNTWSATTSSSWLEIDAVTYVGTSNKVLMGGKGLISGRLAIYFNSSYGAGSSTAWSTSDSKMSVTNIKDIKCLSNTTCLTIGPTNSSVSSRTTTADQTGITWSANSTSGLGAIKSNIYCTNQTCYVGAFVNTKYAVFTNNGSTGNFTLVNADIGYTGNNIVGVYGDYTNNNIIALFQDGVVSKTTNAFSTASVTFTPNNSPSIASNSPPTGGDVQIACLGSNCIVSAGKYSNGVTQGIYYSTNYGVSWTQSPTSGTSTIGSVTSLLYVESTIALGADGGRIFRSTNGGVSWSIILIANVTKISCAGANCVGIVPGTSTTTTYVSTNKGQTWASGTTIPFKASSIFCWQNSCIAGGATTTTNKTYKLATISTATSWTASSTYPTAALVYGISCAGNNCIAGARTATQNAILKSTDSGSSWVQTTPSILNTKGSLQNGYLVCSGSYCVITYGNGGNTTIYITSDYGNSWYIPAAGYSATPIDTVALWYD